MLRETSFTLTFQNFLKIALSICKNNFNCLNCFHLVFFFKQLYLQVDNYFCLLKANWNVRGNSLKPVDLQKKKNGSSHLILLLILKFESFFKKNKYRKKSITFCCLMNRSTGINTININKNIKLKTKR